jgi:hypothetical protein
MDVHAQARRTLAAFGHPADVRTGLALAADQLDGTEARHGGVDVTARCYIEQSRCAIASAWIQIEAAREMLKRTRGLLERWAERSPTSGADESARLKSPRRSEAARIGMLVPVERPSINRYTRRNSSGIKFGNLAARSRRRLVSG